MFAKGNQINTGRKQTLEHIAKRIATTRERDPEGKRYEKAKKTRAVNIASGAVVPKPTWNKGGHLTPQWAKRIGQRAIERHFTHKIRPEICRMYVEDGMTAKAIAERIGTVKEVIVKRLREEGIKIRGGKFDGTEKYRKGVVVSSGTRKKLSVARKANFKNPEFMKMFCKSMHISPNKPEKKIFKLLENLYPNEWKFTGDFSFTINGKCPDFVNCNGQKKIIELFGDYWHRGQDPQDRINIFKPFGYDTLVIWEHELKDMEAVKNKIQGFYSGIDKK